MKKKAMKPTKKHITIDDVKSLAGIFTTKGKMTKMLLAERAKDKARENKKFS